MYVANVMTRPGETTSFTVAEHVGPGVTNVLVHSGELPEELVVR